MLRRLMRNAAEWMLRRSGAVRRGRHRHRDDVVILAYHNVVPDDAPVRGDRSLHLPLRDFREQLDYLREHYDVVSLESVDQPRRGRPRAAVTFDDAYAGALELGVPELVDRDMPATVFVCPGLLDEPGFWWDRLAPDGEGATLSEGVRQAALHELGGRQRAILERFDGPPEEAWWMLPGSEEAVLRAAHRPGISLACHTWDHPNLTALSGEEVASQLGRTAEWLRERVPESSLPRHLSFPYGLFDEGTVRAAEDLRFEVLYRIEGGPAGPPGGRPWVAPRLNVPSGVSLAGFELRASGVVRGR